MWGCESCEIVFASRSKRCRMSAEEERCFGSTLTATVRPRRVSVARQPSPIPPAPTGEAISYGPSRVPVARVTWLPRLYRKAPAGAGALETPGREDGQRVLTQPRAWFDHSHW